MRASLPVKRNSRPVRSQCAMVGPELVAGTPSSEDGKEVLLVTARLDKVLEAVVIDRMVL